MKSPFIVLAATGLALVAGCGQTQDTSNNGMANQSEMYENQADRLEEAADNTGGNVGAALENAADQAEDKADATQGTNAMSTGR